MRRLLFTLLSLILISSFTACTEPGETTAIGAATGGVIGAGLGAIVGNQTGDAGAGLAIGAVAGAGTGAAIGNALEAQQKSIRTQDEAIERQQKMLAAQNAEIRELRNMPQDTHSSIKTAFESEARRPSRASSVNLDANSSLSLTDQLNTGADRGRVSPQARNTTQTFSSPAAFNSYAPEPKAAIKPQALEVAPASRSNNSLNEKTLELAPQPKPQPELQVEEQKPVETKRVVSESASLSPSAECEKANLEASKATSSKEPADKLFYLRRAIRLCPSNAQFHKDLADEYAQLGRNEDAKASYESALKLNPSMVDAKKNLAALSSNHY